MDNFAAVSDPSDWTSTSLPTFELLEAALRCHVCKDFFQTPMITSCSHTFCSLCIRRCLSADGKCPACRATDQASRLRRNDALTVVVETFQAARAQALEIANEHNKRKQEAVEDEIRPQKRRRLDRTLESIPAGSQRQTRSRTKTHDTIGSTNGAGTTIVESDPEDGDYTDGNEDTRVPNDGLGECPICHERMPVGDIWDHSSTCDGTRRSAKKTASHTNTIVTSRPVVQRKEPISQLNYSMLNEKDLRKKLSERGVKNTTGSKQQLITRHTEWVNIWNANCDSKTPRSTEELRHELDAWERAQAKRSHITDIKGINAETYMIDHKDNFASLITQARAKAKSARDTPTANATGGVKQSDVLTIASTDQHQTSVNGDDAAIEDDGATAAMDVTQEAPPEEQQANGDGHAAAPTTALPGHFSDAGTKKVPMFSLPTQPVTDVDHGQK